MKRILVTGPDGFVGSTLCKVLLNSGYAVRGAQLAEAPLPDGCESVVVGNIGAETDWSEVLKDIDCVVHLAARVHIMKDTAEDPLEAFRAVNVEGTRRLATEAITAGVERLILMSTIKVNGERTDCRMQMNETLTSQAMECGEFSPLSTAGVLTPWPPDYAFVYCLIDGIDPVRYTNHEHEKQNRRIR